MVHHRNRVITLALLVTVVGGVPLRARADDFTTGNGHKNRNLLSVRSPTFNRGIQHITNSNIGSTGTQAAFCRQKFRHCRIVQRLIVFDP